MSFAEIFKSQFYDKMLQPISDGPVRNRADTFLKVFQLLEDQKLNFYTIVETGCIRRDHGDLCFGDDGGSTYLFDQFVNHNQGMLYSIDISKKNCDYAKSKVSEKTSVYCSDSVKMLWGMQPGVIKIDFLYLDSFDLIAEDPHPSQQHHLKELCAVSKNLRKGSLVVVDDHFTGLGIGKGMYVKDFMGDIGAELLFEEYQIGWRI